MIVVSAMAPVVHDHQVGWIIIELVVVFVVDVPFTTPSSDHQNRISTLVA